jgi:ParB/RepB/Spo0J family partition protein
MPKMENAGRLRQISLAQIVENGNVRKDYTDIEELAESIRMNGLIEPIVVKALGKNEDGVEEYDLVAGFRRHRAYQYLCEKGESFTMIDATLVTGDKLTLQLVENLQRADLTHPEQEAGITSLVKTLGSNKEAASRLGKSDAFIAHNITAHRVRETLEKFGIKTVSLSTATLTEIQSLTGNKLKDIATKLVAGGGTKSLARQLMREHNSSTAKAETLIQSDEPKQPEPAETPDDNNEPQDVPADGDTTDTQETPVTTDIEEPKLPTAEPGEKSSGKKAVAKVPARELEEPPHMEVSLNSVQLVIKSYIDKIEGTQAGYEYTYKTEAAYEIWASLLLELGGT